MISLDFHCHSRLLATIHIGNRHQFQRREAKVTFSQGKMRFSSLSMAAIGFAAQALGIQVPLLTPTHDKGLSGRYLHITDIHIDPLYREGASLDNGCHYYPEEKDEPESVDKPMAGRFGAPQTGCDAPEILVNQTFQYIDKYLSPRGLDFVVWTGDNARHDSDPKAPRKESEIWELNRILTQKMLTSFGNGSHESIPVLPSIGNNDVYPHNTLAYDPLGDTPTLNYYAQLWAPLIPAKEVPGFKIHGSFYKELVKNSIIGLSFNTMYLFNSNPYADKCGIGNQSPGDVVLKWLRETLQLAREKNWKAIVSGHVPPNTVNFIPSCYFVFAKICQEYADVIQAQFYGHVNIDHFFFPVYKEYPTLSKADYEEIKRNETRKQVAKTGPSAKYPKMQLPQGPYKMPHMPSWISSYLENLLQHYRYAAKEQEVLTAPIFVSPSVVPAFNPGLRVVKYDVISGAVLDYEQYYADLRRWNAVPPKDYLKIEKELLEDTFYELEYQPVDEYEFKDKTAKPKSWSKFAGRLSRIGKQDWLDELKKKKKKKKKKRRPEHGGGDKEEDWLLKTYLRHLVVNVDLTT